MAMTITDKYIDLGGTVYVFDRMAEQPKTKDNAAARYIVSVCQSWTFARMTPEEKERCIEAFLFAIEQGLVIGNAMQRWRQFDAIYNAYLAALGYDGMGWREA